MTKKRAHPAQPWARAKAARSVLTRVDDWAEPHVGRLLKALHPAQRGAVEDPAIRVALLCPGRAGKSTAAEVRLQLTMLRKRRANCLFIAVTKEQAAEICWERFKEIFDNLGVEYSAVESKHTIRLVKNGSVLRLVGADDRKEIGKLRGTPRDAVVIDEAASHPAKLLDDLIERCVGPRMGERDGWIMMIGTPGHILAGPFYDATRPGGPTHRPFRERDQPQWAGVEREWSSHHWNLAEAAKYVEASRRSWAAALRLKELKGWLDTNPIWMREYLGLWAADDTDMIYKYRPHNADGTPRNQWDPARAGKMQLAVLPPEIAADALHLLIFDKGFTDAFAVNVYSLSPSDPRRRLWHRYGFETPGMFVRKFAVLVLGAREDDPELPRDASEAGGLIGELGDWPAAIEGDVDGAFVADLAGYGVPAARADKKADNKATTIEEVNGDFAEERIYVLKDSALEQQLQTCQWVPDEFGAVKENKNQANHSTDTLVYAKRRASKLFDAAAPPPAPDADGDRPARAKRSRPHHPQRASAPAAPVRSEEWSDLLAPATYEGPAW